MTGCKIITVPKNLCMPKGYGHWESRNRKKTGGEQYVRPKRVIDIRNTRMAGNGRVQRMEPDGTHRGDTGGK